MTQTGQMTIRIKQETDRNHGHIENTGTLRLTKYSERITNKKTSKQIRGDCANEAFMVKCLGMDTGPMKICTLV